MKYFIYAFLVLAVLAASFALVSSAFAQTPNPQNPTQPGYSMGMMGRGRMMNGQPMARGEGFMHEEMVAAFAAKLGMSAADLEKQLVAGQSMAQIAANMGFTPEQFQRMWTEAHAQALDAAVKNGKITQAQADWMKSRNMGGMMNGGMMNGRGRMGGAGMNPGCPYYNNTTTGAN